MTTNSSVKPNLQKLVKPYCIPDERKSWTQVANTIIPLLVMIVASYWTQQFSVWASVPFLIVGGLLITRTFIIMHDCGHGSFFKNKNTRDLVGIITGIICFTPYRQWTREHAAHHQHSGDLDFRGRGDVWTLTYSEYENASWLEKLQYYLYRHPIVTFGIGPIFIFQFRHRITLKTDRALERNNVYLTNFALVGFFAVMSYFFGFKNVMLVHMPMTFVAQLVGCLLFYVQHQYEETYWSQGERWSYNSAALEGCSYLKLPKVLQWFTGNIGFHHIHHLNHKIPNYNLEPCYNEVGLFQAASTLTLKDMIPCIGLKIYDESTGKMLTWSQVRAKTKSLQFSHAQ